MPVTPRHCRIPLLMVLCLAAVTDARADEGLSPTSVPTIVIEAHGPTGPTVAESGEAQYGVRSQDIEAMPAGRQAALSDVLARLPGVAIDQNQQIHVRDTEGPQFQYQIDGFLVPLDINTNPPFLSLLDTAFIDQLTLRLGVLPARYGFATGGVVDIRTKGGCQAPGERFTLLAGQRATLSAAVDIATCTGALGTYLSAGATWSNTAFSSATPGPTPVHDQG